MTDPITDPAPDLPPQPRPGEKPIPNDLPPQPTPMPKPDLPPQSLNPAPSPIPPAAQRALAEAETRRQQVRDIQLPRELGGRDGPEPVRFGDWEKKGIAIDF